MLFFLQQLSSLQFDKAMSGTRSTVSLAGSPGSLVRNFRAYIAALNARLDLSRSGHGGQSLQKLVAVGRRLDVLGLKD